jgi:xanthine dehydrogenase molybdopterin-binding subunit B
VASQGRGNQPQQPPVDPKYNWPSTPRTVVGTRVKRLDGPDKVSGRAKYTFDVTRPGMLYARVVRSPYPHARVVSVDLSAAERVPRLQDGADSPRTEGSEDRGRHVPGGRGRGGRRGH